MIDALAMNYIGDRAAFADPCAWPAVGDLRGLPPTYIVNRVRHVAASGEAFGDALAAAAEYT